MVLHPNQAGLEKRLSIDARYASTLREPVPRIRGKTDPEVTQRLRRVPSLFEVGPSLRAFGRLPEGRNVLVHCPAHDLTQAVRATVSF